MHRLTAVQRPWVPHTVMWDALGGGPTALPERVLAAATEELQGFWRASDLKPTRARLPGARHMPPLKATEIMGAALSFIKQTSSSLGEVHPRHVAMLPTAGLHTLSILFSVMEMVSNLPSQLAFLLTAMIPKGPGSQASGP